MSHHPRTLRISLLTRSAPFDAVGKEAG